ncbi:ParB/RepB/Spo0J family partition protein [Parvularcula sp. IMCC14364]|uniref:ParB/RepB/Spo0J family partition protein n=1 Tax=Parvularcula sp. IMCC14364 TaxID=3067902 RepID=UPI002740F3E8|nr:ParB/RepB/Spo0J family partition protein [Parvularcula sp. IMCC14364]
MAKKGLGRGLDVLLGEATPHARDAVPAAGVQEKLPIEFIIPDPKQPRKTFSDEAIDELAASISEKGMLQPILVRPDDDEPNKYRIVAGERRWRAAQRAKLHEVPVIIRIFSDAETAEIALIENLQRVDLNPMEEAEAYAHLGEAHTRNQNEIADAVGKSRSHVANMMRLLKLPESVRLMVREGALSMGHARALLASESPQTIAEQIVKKGLSVRQTEKLAKQPLGKDRAESDPSRSGKKDKPSTSKKDADTRALERDLAEALGLDVGIEHKGKKGGKLFIDYRSLDQLDEVCRRLMNVSV